MKPSLISGRNLNLRMADKSDAAFILSIRIDGEKSRHLNKVEDNIQKQIDWLERCQKDMTQEYYIIETKEKKRVGTIRIYDIKDGSYCWGSWIIIDAEPFFYSIESSVMMYKYCLMKGLGNAKLDIRKKNKTVWRFHESYGAIKESEDDIDVYYRVEKEAIALYVMKYKKFSEITIMD